MASKGGGGRQFSIKGGKVTQTGGRKSSTNTAVKPRGGRKFSVSGGKVTQKG